MTPVSEESCNIDSWNAKLWNIKISWTRGRSNVGGTGAEEVQGVGCKLIWSHGKDKKCGCSRDSHRITKLIGHWLLQAMAPSLSLFLFCRGSFSYVFIPVYSRPPVDSPIYFHIFLMRISNIQSNYWHFLFDSFFPLLCPVFLLLFSSVSWASSRQCRAW